jgi:hypothetical protein
MLSPKNHIGGQSRYSATVAGIDDVAVQPSKKAGLFIRGSKAKISNSQSPDHSTANSREP